MSTPGALKAMRNLTRWSRGGEWGDDFFGFIDRYFDRIGKISKVERAEFEDVVGSAVVDTLIAWATESFWTHEFEPDHDNVIDDYLKRRGWKDTAGGRRYLKALRNSVVSVYEVIGVTRESHVVVRDLLRGGDGIRVEDVEGSKVAVIWDRIAARVVSAGEKPRFSGCVLPLSFDAAERVAKMLWTLAENTHADTEDASVRDNLVKSYIPNLVGVAWALDIYGEMLDLLDDADDEDGESLDSVHFDYPITGETGQIEKALDECPHFVRMTGNKSVWRCVERKKSAPLLDRVPSYRNDEIEETLGIVFINEAMLSVGVPSPPQAERVGTLLTDALSGEIGPPRIVELDDDDELIDEEPPWNAGDLETRLEDFWRDHASRFNEELDRRYAVWLAEKHEMLDDMSPREAVARDGGDRKVADLLKFVENANARQMQQLGAPQYDYSWLWHELGIDGLRH